MTSRRKNAGFSSPKIGRQVDSSGNLSQVNTQFAGLKINKHQPDLFLL